MTETIARRLTAALADRYAIERQVGQGGMATVYLARDLRHDRKVALKVLRPELAAVIGAERFLQESGRDDDGDAGSPGLGAARTGAGPNPHAALPPRGPLRAVRHLRSRLRRLPARAAAG